MGDNLFVGALVANGASHFWIDTGIHIIIQDFMLILLVLHNKNHKNQSNDMTRIQVTLHVFCDDASKI